MTNMHYIYYLVYSYKKDGYVLSSELEDDEWNLGGNGVFALLQADQTQNAATKYYIKAIDQGEEKEYPLYHREKNTGIVTLENAEEIFFNITWGHKLIYKGRNKINAFAVLTPTDILRLEELCLEQGFFFVGY